MAAVAPWAGCPPRGAFLDLAEPDLETVVGDGWPSRATARAVVVPLLFTEAFHATVDVPRRGRRGRRSGSGSSS